MLTYFLFLTPLLFLNLDLHAQTKYCNTNINSINNLIPLIIVKNPGSTLSNININKMLNHGELVVDKRIVVNEVASMALFKEDFLAKGDCLLLNLQEESLISVMLLESYLPWHSFFSGVKSKAITNNQNLVPVIIKRFQDQSRHFGYIPTNQLEQLEKISINELKTSELIQHKIPADLFVIYILCDQKREKSCEVKMRKGNRWLKTRTKLDVLARSRRESPTIIDKNNSYRITINGDTPQGIYYLWGSLFTDNPVFGNIHRLDLDAAFAPINSYIYEINRYLLEQLVPSNSLNDYWIQEWPLAFNLGRNSLRLHDNSLDSVKPNNFLTKDTEIPFRTTDGCINTGRNMKYILDILLAEKIISAEDLSSISEPEKLNWKALKNLGKSFIIVKDL